MNKFPILYQTYKFLKPLTKRSAFLLPFFIFAGLFKKQPFVLARFYMDLTFWLTMILLFLGIFRTKKFLIISKYNPLLWIVLPLSFFILITPMINLINGENLPYFSWKVKQFLFMVVPSVLFSYWHLRSERDWLYFRSGLLLISFYTSIYLFITPPIARWGDVNYLLLGTIPAIGGILIFYEILFKENQRYSEELYRILLFSLFSLGVLYSFSRGQQILYSFMLSLLLARFLFNTLLLSLVLRAKFVYKKALKLLVIVIICFTAIFFVLNKSSYFFVRFKRLDQGLSVRYMLFEKAIDLFELHPVIPLGIGGYYFNFETEEFKYPHNMFLEVLSELGILGGIWYILVILIAFSGYLQCRKVWFIGSHFYIFLFLLLLSCKQDSLFTAKAFWAWTSMGIGLLNKRNFKKI